VLISVPRVRLVCTPVPANLHSVLSSTPRPPQLPGKQLAGVLDYYFWRETVFPRSIHLTDLAAFLGPGDADDMQQYRGYNMLQVNVTRVCLSYVSSDCKDSPEICVTSAVQAILDQEGQPGRR
jgi:hypothetical protein